MSEAFKTLNSIDVNDKTEKKNGLTYLSWAWAWAQLKKVYPDATYQIRQFDGKPYLYDKNLGYMVMTEMTVDGITHEMWLPVMDGANKAMKDEPYTVRTKYKEIEVQSATMFDINTAIMRCLTKNIAMFGLGLYIYAGEDLPEEAEDKKKADKEEEKLKQQAEEIAKMPIAPVKVQVLKKRCSDDGVAEEKVLKHYNLKSFENMTEEQFRHCTDYWNRFKEM